MPEYILAVLVSAGLACFGILNRKAESIDSRIDKLEVKLAETYVTKADLRLEFDRMGAVFSRLEDKIDAHVSEEPARIQKMKSKYNLF